VPGELTLALEIRGPISRADLPGLCHRVCTVLTAGGARVVRCDVRSVEPDAVTVEALARLQLVAGRLGCRVLLYQASTTLVELVAFMGLTNVLASDEFPATRPSESSTTTRRRNGCPA
jgi:ABC-type transporter Mla MlaB component